MDLKYLQNISPTGVATILLYDFIGDSLNNDGTVKEGINGRDFADEIEYLQGQCERIDIRINSAGGSIIEGMSIVSAILNSQVPVHTHIDGLAASMAGIIAVCGTKRYMKDFGSLMVHNPSGGNKNVRDILKENLITILSNNSNLGEVKLSSMMDAETWFTPKEALKANLVDEIVPSRKKVNIDKSSLASMVECYNSIITKNMNEKNDTVIHIDKLVDSVEVSDQSTNPAKAVSKALADIINADQEQRDIDIDNALEQVAERISIEDLQNQIKTLTETLEKEKKEKENIAAQLEQVRQEKELAKRKEATDFINAFIIDGRIQKEESDKYVNLALTDFDFAKSILSKMGNKEAVKIFNATDIEANPRSGWTIRDWEIKDSAGLLKMKNETPDMYDRLYKEFYINK